MDPYGYGYAPGYWNGQYYYVHGYHLVGFGFLALSAYLFLYYLAGPGYYGGYGGYGRRRRYRPWFGAWRRGRWDDDFSSDDDFDDYIPHYSHHRYHHTYMPSGGRYGYY